MEYSKAVTTDKVLIEHGIAYRVIIILCPDCGRDLNCLTPGFMHCDHCQVYFELGIYKIER